MLDKKMVPEIRFKGFKEDWKESKIGNFLSIPIEEKVDVNNASQLLTLGLNLSGLKNGATKNKLHFGATNYFLRKEGQFIYGKQNFFNGSMAIITPEFDNKASSKDVPSFNVNNIDNWFFYYYLARPSFYEKTEDLSLGTGSKRIHENILFNISIAHPELLEEQKKIRSLISNLNSIVSFNSIKLNKLRVIKQSLLDKMFASYDQKIPEIRFKGFDESWKLNKFSDLYNCSNEKNINIRYTEKNIISVANMYFKDEQKISNAEYLKSYNIFHLGDIAYEGNKSANYRYGRFVVNTIGPGIVSHVFEVFKPVMKEYNLYFWKYYINSESIMRNVLRDSTKSATMMATLVKKDLSNQFIKITSIAEQQKIGQFFSNLDSLIRSQEQKLEKLNNIKQALLEKMFC
ncbi:restriction endonuclease subunit S [Mycoplasma sp. 653B]|uniref:restriction endonuclease subunit S n=1 Tax=Mycoplasma sp. 653B TaxID=3401677 RepID=UPI003AB0CCEA